MIREQSQEFYLFPLCRRPADSGRCRPGLGLTEDRQGRKGIQKGTDLEFVLLNSHAPPSFDPLRSLRPSVIQTDSCLRFFSNPVRKAYAPTVCQGAEAFVRGDWRGD